MTATADFLMAKFGVTMDQAKIFIISVASQPSMIAPLFNFFKSNTITNQMVADILGGGIAASNVKSFFFANGLDGASLDGGTSTTNNSKTIVDIRSYPYYDSYGKPVHTFDASKGSYEYLLDTRKLINDSMFNMQGYTNILNFGADDSIHILTNDKAYPMMAQTGYGGTSMILAGAYYPGYTEQIFLPGITITGVVNSVGDFNALPIGDLFIN